ADVDYAAIAEGVGLPSVRITDPKKLRAQLKSALKQPGPMLIDVVTNRDACRCPRRSPRSRSVASPPRPPRSCSAAAWARWSTWPPATCATCPAEPGAVPRGRACRGAGPVAVPRGPGISVQVLRVPGHPAGEGVECWARQQCARCTSGCCRVEEVDPTWH